MKLTELDPKFIRAKRIDDKYWAKEYVTDISAAHGVMFFCPQCFEANEGPYGTHRITIWTEAADIHDTPKIVPNATRWTLSGSSLEDLSISPSIRVQDGCGAHFTVQNGEIITSS